MRASDGLVFGLIVAQVIAGLVAGWWRSTTPRRRPRQVDLTDLTALSRSASTARRLK